ncbi:uncharacterized protein LOC131068430 [Cryptomeria japonica]|uniref:uncharacterized protein LOC131068430 n=1 Tax=Cryptomeria japonica TaxID=3369 RepID=UPI0027DA6A94|nr:uncharacterized protein LOC131068430 [Cryptomeria japonica]
MAAITLADLICIVLVLCMGFLCEGDMQADIWVFLCTLKNNDLPYQKVFKEGNEKKHRKRSSEVQSSKTERSLENEALRLVKGEKESQKKVDRLSNEWVSMLEKIRSEERRMRERVKDLAEKNVELQREVSSWQREIDARNQVNESQQCMDLKMKSTDAENEILKLREAFSESVKNAKQAEAGRDLMQWSYREKERENSELQKSVFRLQRLCRDQERTIGGLWGELDNKINDCAQDRDACITQLQKEQLRLVGVEKALRKDLENFRWEADGLRYENTYLLDRMQSNEKGTSTGLIKLDQELWNRLDQLLVQAFPLLDENVRLSFKLLYYVKRKFSNFNGCEINEGEHSLMSETGQEWNHVLELDVMAQILRRKQDVENPQAYQQEQQDSESEEELKQLKQELKTKTLLVKILREKLCSNAADVERLEDEVATLVRSREVLKSNIERLHGRLKELTFLRREIPKVSEERDGFDQDAEQLTMLNIKFIAEVGLLKMRVKELDEDVLVKEGQLSVLQESLNAKICRKQ